MKLVIASNNSHKIDEIRSIIDKNITLLNLSEIGCYDEIEESGTTLEDNAQLKSSYVFNKYGYNCFADDTGLEVNALNGEPGVHSARYSGEDRSSEKNIDKLLANLALESNRSAQFRTVISLNINNNMYLFEGVVKGRISEERKGVNGFGYDSVFIPDGYDKSFAELDSQIKNSISHRSIAVNKLVNFLNSSFL